MTMKYIYTGEGIRGETENYIREGMNVMKGVLIMLKKTMLLLIMLIGLSNTPAAATYEERPAGKDSLFVEVKEYLPYNTGEGNQKIIGVTIQRLIHIENKTLLDGIMLKTYQKEDTLSDAHHLQIKTVYLCTLNPFRLIRKFTATDKRVTLHPPYRTEHSIPTNGATNADSRDYVVKELETAKNTGKPVYLRIITTDDLYTDILLPETFCNEAILLFRHPNTI